MMEYLDRLIYKYNQYNFNKQAAQVRQTKPIAYTQDNRVTIVTMVGHDAVDMYLLSIKSFMRNFGFGTIEAINDGSLTQDDRQVLEHHVPGIRITEAKDVDTGTCPTYISWKRLCRIVQLVQDSYVIQLDSDIVCMNPLVEIYDKVTQNEGYLIGCCRWPPTSIEYLANIVSQWPSTHVQPSVERILPKLNLFDEQHPYLRGCAGFAGYSKGCIDFDSLQALSHKIEEQVGRDKWSEWGSEQTATICVISLSDNAGILPWPKYQNFMFPLSNFPAQSSSATHFVGTNRFKDTTYLKLAKHVIKDHS